MFVHVSVGAATEIAFHPNIIVLAMKLAVWESGPVGELKRLVRDGRF
jgi:hypothetical protein